MRGYRALSVVPLACFRAWLCSPLPSASEGIESFTTTTSTSQAGGHPDLDTVFNLRSPGAPEAAQNVIFNAPEGRVRQHQRDHRSAPPSDFALDQCASNSQAGLITVYANYEGNPKYLLGTAPIYDLVPEPTKPHSSPSSSRPWTFRSRSRSQCVPRRDYGLRFTVQDITQLTPLASANLTFWGFPAEAIHNGERFPQRHPGQPARLRGPYQYELHLASETYRVFPNNPLTDNPTTCTGNR